MSMFQQYVSDGYPGALRTQKFAFQDLTLGGQNPKHCRKWPDFHRIWPISEPNAREKHEESDFRVQMGLAGKFGAQFGPRGGSLGVLFSPYMVGTHNYGF